MSGLPSIDEVAASIRGGTSSDPNLPVESGTPVKSEAPQEVNSNQTPNVSAKSEKPLEPEAKKEPEKDKTASRFAALTRKEKEARQAAANFDRRTKEFEARERAFQEREAKLASVDIKKDPLGFMKAHGLSMQDIVSSAYGNYKAPDADPVDEKIRPHAEKFDATAAEVKLLKEQLAAFQANQAETQQRQQYEEVMGGLKGAADGDKEKYELVNAFGDEALDLARDVMVEYYRQHSRLLDYTEACDIVEKHYEEKVIDRLVGTNKIRSRVSPPTTTSAPAGKTAPKQSSKEATEPNTLSNRLSTGAQANVDIDKLSPEEAIAVLSKKLMYR